MPATAKKHKTVSIEFAASYAQDKRQLLENYNPFTEFAEAAQNPDDKARYAEAARTTTTETYVILEGKIFEVGKWPSRRFEMSVETMDNAIQWFTPCFFDYGHVSGPLDGRLGVLRKIWRVENDLYGQAAIPLWLDDKITEVQGERRVSCTWDIEDVMLVGIAHVSNPAIIDAIVKEVFTAFAGNRNNAADQYSIQSIHDLAHLLGAACCTPELPVPEEIPAEMGQFSSNVNTQQEGTKVPMTPAELTAALKEASESQDPQVLAAYSAIQQAQAAGANGAASVAVAAEFQQELAELKANLAFEKSKRLELEESTRTNNAQQYALELVRMGKLFPAHANDWIELFSQLLEDDCDKPEAKKLAAFGPTKKKLSRMDAMLTLLKSAPAQSSLFAEAIPAPKAGEPNPAVQQVEAAKIVGREDLTLLPGATASQPAAKPVTKPEDVSAERVVELLSTTALGQKAVTAYTANKKS